MKKNILSVIAIVCALAALAVSVYAIITTNSLRADQDARLNELEESVTALQMPAATVPAEVSGLADWTLSPAAWAENDGANVMLTATPDAYNESLFATFLVELDGNTAAEVPCRWDGNSYTATANLPAANGYSYRFILSGDQSGQDIVLQATLASEENPSDPLCVYLEDSLTAYCNLIIVDWTAGETLTISTAFGHIQLPQLSHDGNTQILSDTRLILKLNGEELSRQALSTAPGEASGSFEADISGISFELPGMDENDELELWLEASLSDGSSVTACGASWYAESGELVLVSG